MSGPSAIVVGAGAFGASTAFALARRGWAVTLVDQHAPGNARGSSGDRTRLLRLGHAEWDDARAAWYTASAARGIAGWQALADAADLDLLQRTGLVWLEEHDTGDGALARTERRLGEAGIACERIGLDAAAARFPSLGTDDLAGALWEPEAHVIRADAAVKAMVAAGAAHGVRLLLDRATPAGPGTVALAGGGTLAADHVVWAGGAWLGTLFGEEVPVRAAWQEVLHWASTPAWRDCPAFFDESAEVYGFPDVDGLGVKAVTHHPGPTFDLDRTSRVPTPEGIARIEAYVERRFPALAGCGLLWARVMPYEMTPDSHFVLGASREDARRWYLGGGSGHGFKHAPALGELLAECLEGTATPEAMHAPGPRAV